MDLKSINLYTQNSGILNDVSLLERQVEELRLQLSNSNTNSLQYSRGSSSQELKNSQIKLAQTNLRTFNWIIRQSALLKIMKANNIAITDDFIKDFNKDIEDLTSVYKNDTNEYTKTWHQAEEYIALVGDQYEKPMIEKKNKILNSLKTGRKL